MPSSDLVSLRLRVSLTLNLAGTRSSPDRSTKSTRLRSCGASTACGHGVSGSLSLPSRGSFHLSFTVLCSIGHQQVFSLAGWSPLLPTGFHVSRGTPDPAARVSGFTYGAFTLSGRSFQFRSATLTLALCSPYPGMLRIPVWAHPVSLAATPGIEFSFFSSSYLDVSVRRVPPAWLWIHHAVTEVCSAGFPHSDIGGSVPVCSSPQLFAAYHVLLRPLVPRHPPRAFCCLTIAYPYPAFSCTALLIPDIFICFFLSFTSSVALL